MQGSPLSLNAAEQALLDRNGFVLSDRHTFPTFLYGYETIYMADLPLYVSADSILHAVHSSYDEILKAIELVALIPELESLLLRMRSNLEGGAPPRSAPRPRRTSTCTSRSPSACSRMRRRPRWQGPTRPWSRGSSARRTAQQDGRSA